AGSLVGADLNEGTSGNASRATPTILKRARSHFTVTHSFSSFLKLTGASGNSLAILKSFRACTHIDPGVVISSASISQRTVTSRSVPVIRIVFSPTDSMRMFERTGIVFFFSTTPCTKPSSFCRFCLLTTNCICHSLLQTIHKPSHLFFYSRIQKLIFISSSSSRACGYVNKDLILPNQRT